MDKDRSTAPLQARPPRRPPSQPPDQPPTRARARVRSKVWVERDGQVLLSEWRVELLEAVEAEGSLAAAAATLGVPYRTAWDRIKETEERLGLRLLRTESGGAEGGGSHLTPEGRELVRRFRRVTSGVAELVERRFRAELDDLLG